MSIYCYYGRIQVDSESLRQTHGVHLYMVKENSDKLFEKICNRLDKEFTKTLKPLVAELKKVQKEVKVLTARLDKLSPVKPKKAKTPKSSE